ncbi:MAG: hypothetical protein NUV82_02845 [Candidatus Komeilibacteria bacterium]|nr:hypothetical protein [Candidatus Komeilibacteria bacterium]
MAKESSGKKINEQVDHTGRLTEEAVKEIVKKIEEAGYVEGRFFKNEKGELVKESNPEYFVIRTQEKDYFIPKGPSIVEKGAQGTVVNWRIGDYIDMCLRKLKAEERTPIGKSSENEGNG